MSRYAPGSTATTTAGRPKPILSEPKPDRSSLEAKRAAVANATTRQAQQAKAGAGAGAAAGAAPYTNSQLKGFGVVASGNEHGATIDKSTPTYGFGEAVRSDNVGAIANEYMKHDNPLMERSRTMGRQFGAARGMLNSSMSAGAAQTAALDQVVPMAQTQAQVNTERGEGMLNRSLEAQENALTRTHESSENQLTRTHESSENQLTRKHESAENRLTREATASENKKQRTFEQTENAKTRQATRQENAKTRQHERETKAKDREFERQIKKIEGDANTKERAGTMATNALSHYNQLVANTNNNTELSASERTAILGAARDNLDATFDSINNLFKLDVKWPTHVEGDRAAGDIKSVNARTNPKKNENKNKNGGNKKQSQFEKDMARLGRDTGKLR